MVIFNIEELLEKKKKSNFIDSYKQYYLKLTFYLFCTSAFSILFNHAYCVLVFDYSYYIINNIWRFNYERKCTKQCRSRREN